MSLLYESEAYWVIHFSGDVPAAEGPYGSLEEAADIAFDKGYDDWEVHFSDSSRTAAEAVEEWGWMRGILGLGRYGELVERDLPIAASEEEVGRKGIWGWLTRER